jgi:hypothetical protein
MQRDEENDSKPRHLRSLKWASPTSDSFDAQVSVSGDMTRIPPRSRPRFNAGGKSAKEDARKKKKKKSLFT